MNIDISHLNMRDVDWSINSIINRIKSHDILMQYFIQKEFIPWTQAQKSLFIESIFIRAPMPQLVMHSDHNNYTIIDGLNRLNTIIEYIDNKFELCNLAFLTDFEGNYFSDFNRAYQRRIEETRIKTYVIESIGNPELSKIVAKNYF